MSDSVGLPETAAHEAPPSLGFSRQEHWSGLPFPSPMHESEVAQSCQTPSDPMDCSLQGSSVYEVFQARVLEWGASVSVDLDGNHFCLILLCNRKWWARETPVDRTLGDLQFLFRIATGAAGVVGGITLPSQVAPSPSSRERKDMRTVVPALHT